MGKKKGKTLMQQFDWLEKYLKDDNHPCKKAFLKTVKDNISRNKWSVLKDKQYQYLESIIDNETALHAGRIISKYMGVPLLESFHNIGLWYMDQFLNIMKDFGDEERCEIYGFLSEYGAFNKNGSPALVLMNEYHGRHIVWISDEITDDSDSDYIQECDIFDTRKEADRYFDSLIGKGLKNGYEQIHDCLEKVIDAKFVDIEPVSNIFGDVYFKVYYKCDLLLEHMMLLLPETINCAITQYKEQHAGKKEWPYC